MASDHCGTSGIYAKTFLRSLAYFKLRNTTKKEDSKLAASPCRAFVDSIESSLFFS